MSNTSSGLGAAYGTAKSGIGIAGIGTYRPDLIMKVITHAVDQNGSLHYVADIYDSLLYRSSCQVL
jgi:hypothetical protein